MKQKMQAKTNPCKPQREQHTTRRAMSHLTIKTCKENSK
jgi:hypothetical protein